MSLALEAYYQEVNSLACWRKSRSLKYFFFPAETPAEIKSLYIIICFELIFFFFFLPEMLPDLVWLHFIQKLPQILAGTAVVCSVWLRGLCKPAYSTHTVQYSTGSSTTVLGDPCMTLWCDYIHLLRTNYGTKSWAKHGGNIFMSLATQIAIKSFLLILF